MSPSSETAEGGAQTASAGLGAPRGAPWRAVLSRLALAFGSALVLLAWIETLVVTAQVAPPRQPPVMVWNPEQDRDLQAAAGEFRFHPRWLWEPRPGARAGTDRINPGAYRGPFYPEERTEALRIAALGDSSTYAFGVDEERGWPRRLEALLREQGLSVEVLNFGCVGYTVRQGLELYRGKVRRYRPDIVIEAFGAVNDSVTVAQGVTDGDKIELLNDPLLRTVVYLRRYAAFRWLESAIGGVTSRDDSGRSVRRVPPDAFRDCLLMLDREVRADGGRLLVVIPPRRVDAERLVSASARYPAIALETALEHDIPYANVYETFRARDRAEGADDPDAAASPRFIDPWHPSADGHELYARIVALALVKYGLIELPGMGGG